MQVIQKGEWYRMASDTERPKTQKVCDTEMQMIQKCKCYGKASDTKRSLIQKGKWCKKASVTERRVIRNGQWYIRASATDRPMIQKGKWYRKANDTDNDRGMQVIDVLWQYEVPVKFQSDTTIATSNLAASRLHEIWSVIQTDREYRKASDTDRQVIQKGNWSERTEI